MTLLIKTHLFISDIQIYQKVSFFNKNKETITPFDSLDHNFIAVNIIVIFLTNHQNMKQEHHHVHLSQEAVE